ncbi:hypothetical protein KJ671_02130 [Patescibacteria group bacterium]|nr:hypothetical protein [Patescibacteria group bacterium]
MDNNLIKNKIAWKVYIVWLFRRIIPLLVLEIILLVLGFYFLGKFVFVQKVFENAFLSSAQNPIIVFLYMFNAFASTTFLKKIIVLILLSLGILCMKDVGRALVSYISTFRITKQG